MPEPANPISMKQPPESLSIRKGCGDMGSDPALLMDKAAAQLAATLQDGVLQKMAGHNHNNHSHERLKDLTSLVLNGDQDSLPKHCTPEPPMLKGDEAPDTNDAHQHNCTPHAEPELKVTIPQVLEQPVLEPSCANGTSVFFLSSSAYAHARNDGADKRRVCSCALLCWGSGLDKGDGVPMVAMHGNHRRRAQQRLGLLYHIQYFGDAPERGFVFEKNMTAPSVPRNLQAQWSMGIIQAKEALSMLPEERMKNFGFIYDGDGPHLNPLVLEKLKPDLSCETYQDAESRLSQDVPYLLVSSHCKSSGAPQFYDPTLVCIIASFLFNTQGEFKKTSTSLVKLLYNILKETNWNMLSSVRNLIGF
ncbi:hypothetical protein XENOCAPTIV_024933 [Xenoophorus captivus]|uniref:Uncharacterized protein n=1 Tax=Xenoophorus captivus TaxID=1517983 RepID=A0ABV0RP33_9TELE